MSNRRRMQDPDMPRRQRFETIEVAIPRRRVSEPELMAVEDDESRPIETPGPEWTPRRLAILLAWIAFGLLVLCGCTAWIVEAVT